MSDTALTKEIMEVLKIYESAIGHAATRTRPMIENHGEIEALSRLVVSADLQKGFKVLRDKDQLDKTFEAVVIRFQHLFKPDVVQAAKWRLEHANDL
jgi:hypothetical protein